MIIWPKAIVILLWRLVFGCLKALWEVCILLPLFALAACIMFVVLKLWEIVEELKHAHSTA